MGQGAQAATDYSVKKKKRGANTAKRSISQAPTDYCVVKKKRGIFHRQGFVGQGAQTATNNVEGAFETHW